MAYTAINKSTAHFDTKLYSGNGATGSGQTITGLGFQPDMTWVKSRGTTDGHTLQDAVRGFGSTTKLSTYDNSGQNNSSGGSYGNYGYQSAATSDGFTMVAGSNPGQNNKSGNNYVSWNWKAGGSTSSNSDGDVTSTVSVNSTAGFSIVKWTNNGNASWIGHGLGTIPHWILIKSLSNSASSITAWVNYHQGMHVTTPEDYTAYLNNSDARVDNPVFNDTLPTSTKFRFDSADTTDYIAYCFAEKAGFSKIGSYIGNGNADGPFAYCGFKPTWTMIRRVDNADNWSVWDNKRNINGYTNYTLEADTTSAEWSDANFRHEYVSNGFKIRNTFPQTNASGGRYIYIAFGQSLVGSNNIPCTAG